jgi:hypothetical protein
MEADFCSKDRLSASYWQVTFLIAKILTGTSAESLVQVDDSQVNLVTEYQDFS